MTKDKSDLKWKDVYVKYRESYYPPITDFHEHDYYEINFIESGNVKVFLPGLIDEGCHSRILLTPPGTPHLVSCKPDILYSRFYLLFSKEFIQSSYEFSKLLELFRNGGRVVAVSQSQQDFCKALLSRLEQETSPIRKKLLVLYLLSYIDEFANNTHSVSVPSYIMQAMVYIEGHYNQKILASNLAQKIHVGRTTLMTNFKKYTGLTLNQYITHCRIKKAVALLEEGKTEYDVAENCGFADTGGLIRSFKSFFGMTPRQYLANLNSPTVKVSKQVEI